MHKSQVIHTSTKVYGNVDMALNICLGPTTTNCMKSAPKYLVRLLVIIIWLDYWLACFLIELLDGWFVGWFVGCLAC